MAVRDMAMSMTPRIAAPGSKVVTVNPHQRFIASSSPGMDNVCHYLDLALYTAHNRYRRTGRKSGLNRIRSISARGSSRRRWFRRSGIAAVNEEQVAAGVERWRGTGGSDFDQTGLQP